MIGNVGKGRAGKAGRAMARAMAIALLLPTLVACIGETQRLVFPPPSSAPARGTSGAPPVVDARGAVTPRQAEAIVERLRREGHTDLVVRHLAFMETLGGPALVAGNATRLLVDGPETHRAMFEAIGRAQHHVWLESYIVDDDETGRRLADLLVERRSKGVEVGLLHDAIGTLGTPAEYFDRLRAAGVAVCEFNPVDPSAGRGVRLNHRDHRKILVVDGLVAFTGGINISDVYSSGSASARRRVERGQGWRDTHIEVRGPAVAEFGRLFADTWARQRCASPLVAGPTIRPARAGDRVLRVVASTPEDAVNPIHAELLSAIANAEHSVHVTMAYFVPDPQTIEVLEAAAGRGVDVQLVLPGFSDFWAVFHAGRSHYARLLAAGVRIHERRDALLHAKTAVVDGVWSTVGSANMDWRSFLHNDEINVVVLGEGFGKEMTALFEADVAHAVPIDAATWARRGISNRAKEHMALILEYWL
jgi:cardiolipin synthase A/B